MKNGRLDGLVVLSCPLRMLWRIASVYYQRPPPRQMLYLYSNVGANVLFADNILLHNIKDFPKEWLEQCLEGHQQTQ